MLSVLTTKNNNDNNKKGWKETLEGDGYVYGLDGGDGIMGIYLSPNSEFYILNMHSSLHVNHTSIKGFI